MPSDSNPNSYFKDKEEAAARLIDTLPLELLQNNETVVLGVSKEGVFFADKIANASGATMDILLTEPIVAPNNSELEIAMVSETEEVVMHKALVNSFGISEDYVYHEAQRKYEEEVLSYIYKYRKGRNLVSLSGKYVVLVDECIETGLTMMVALKSVIAKEAKNIYIATPVLDRAVYENLLAVCDGVFCPHQVKDYISIEYYYDHFEQSEFETIVHIVDTQERKRRDIKRTEIHNKTEIEKG